MHAADEVLIYIEDPLVPFAQDEDSLHIVKLLLAENGYSNVPDIGQTKSSDRFLLCYDLDLSGHACIFLIHMICTSFTMFVGLDMYDTAFPCAQLVRRVGSVII